MLQDGAPQVTLASAAEVAKRMLRRWGCGSIRPGGRSWRTAPLGARCPRDTSMQACRQIDLLVLHLPDTERWQRPTPQRLPHTQLLQHEQAHAPPCPGCGALMADMSLRWHISHVSYDMNSRIIRIANPIITNYIITHPLVLDEAPTRNRTECLRLRYGCHPRSAALASILISDLLGMLRWRRRCASRRACRCTPRRRCELGRAAPSRQAQTVCHPAGIPPIPAFEYITSVRAPRRRPARVCPRHAAVGPCVAPMLLPWHQQTPCIVACQTVWSTTAQRKTLTTS
jgi:hypothetical protein